MLAVLFPRCIFAFSVDKVGPKFELTWAQGLSGAMQSIYQLEIVYTYMSLVPNCLAYVPFLSSFLILVIWGGGK